MSILDIGPAVDMEPLVLPPGDYHREWQVENAIADELARRFPVLEISQQERWPGAGIPDIVTRHVVSGVLFINIIEVKHPRATQSAIGQLGMYVLRANRDHARTPNHVVVTGTLAATGFSSFIPRQYWMSFLPLRMAS